MLKRDHPKFKGNWILATRATKLECRETHQVKAFRFLRKKVWCRTSSRSIHAQEGSPKIQRHLNFGNLGNKVGMPRNFTICWRKSYVEQVAEAYMLKRDHPKFKGNWISATRTTKSKCRATHQVKAFRRLRKKVWCRTSSRSIHAQEGSPEIQRQLNFGKTGIEVGTPRNSPSQSVSPFAEESLI